MCELLAAQRSRPDRRRRREQRSTIESERGTFDPGQSRRGPPPLVSSCSAAAGPSIPPGYVSSPHRPPCFTSSGAWIVSSPCSVSRRWRSSAPVGPRPMGEGGALAGTGAGCGRGDGGERHGARDRHRRPPRCARRGPRAGAPTRGRRAARAAPTGRTRPARPRPARLGPDPARRIGAAGAIVSELPPGTTAPALDVSGPQPNHRRARRHDRRGRGAGAVRGAAHRRPRGRTGPPARCGPGACDVAAHVGAARPAAAGARLVAGPQDVLEGLFGPDAPAPAAAAIRRRGGQPALEPRFRPCWTPSPKATRPPPRSSTRVWMLTTAWRRSPRSSSADESAAKRAAATRCWPGDHARRRTT